MSELTLCHAKSDNEVAACFPVMALLRPAIASVDELVRRVARQLGSGYRILAAWLHDTPVALAGHRVEDNLIHGRFIYVGDLVALEGERRGGIGARLLAAAVGSHGREQGCRRPALGTAPDSVLAHRFYYRQGLVARGLRFMRTIEE
jgi:GNAT superfamily N-acetyltransferase